MAFPEVKFGICQRCGRGGTEDSSALTGYELKLYDGEWLCQLCINQLEDKKRDEIAQEHDIEEESFRNSIGFTK